MKTADLSLTATFLPSNRRAKASQVKLAVFAIVLTGKLKFAAIVVFTVPAIAGDSSSKRAAAAVPTGSIYTWQQNASADWQSPGTGRRPPDAKRIWELV